MLMLFLRLPVLLRVHHKVQRALKLAPFDQLLAQFKTSAVLQSKPEKNALASAIFYTRWLRRYAGRFRKPSACLDQAIALRYFLAQQGIAAELKIGVKRQPFAAHAWIEVAGTPVLESDHVQRDFVCFDVLPEGTIALLNPAENKPPL
jgi:Transglutaminase-like superfamily